MHDVFAPLTPPDYRFLVELIESPVNLTDDAGLRRLVGELEAGRDVKAELDAKLERELRYLGSADLAYLARYVSGRAPGVPFEEVIRDAAQDLKVELPAVGAPRELLEALVERYAAQQFGDLPRAEQQRMLEELGVERDRAAAFLKKSAGVFALPALIQAFDLVIVQGLIQKIIFGTIARFIGQQLARRLFTFLAGQFPWWLRWIGPAAWTASLGWAAVDLQGPARRKVIPAVLYLGLCTIRPEAR